MMWTVRVRGPLLAPSEATAPLAAVRLPIVRGRFGCPGPSWGPGAEATATSSGRRPSPIPPGMAGVSSTLEKSGHPLQRADREGVAVRRSAPASSL